MERGSGVAGIGNFNFVPNMLSFLLKTGLRRWYVFGAYVPPKHHSHSLSRGAGAGGGTEGSRDHTPRVSQCTDMRTARCARRIDCNSGGGLWAGQHNRSLTSKEVVQRGELLDVAYEKGKPAGDGVRVLYTCHKQSQRF